MKKGFSLVEMLVVVGIIAVLLGASLGAFTNMRRSADKARCQELVSNAATALAAIYNADGAWPKLIREKSEGDGLMDEKVAYVIAKRKLMSVSYDDQKKQATGLDKFGIVSPWATDALRHAGSMASKSTKVSSGKQTKTVADHILRFKVDLDGDGIIENVQVGGGKIPAIRATAVVWCGGKDGVIDAYKVGAKTDDVYSWAPGQTRDVK